MPEVILPILFFQQNRVHRLVLHNVVPPTSARQIVNTDNAVSKSSDEAISQQKLLCEK